MKTLRTIFAIIFALSAMIFTAGIASASPAHSNVTCSAGTIASGTYASLSVTGACTVPDGGVVTVNGTVVVKAGATFNAMTASTVNLNGNVLVGRDATFAFGCSLGLTFPPFPGGPTFCTAVSHSQVNGNIVAAQPRTVKINGVTVNGNIVSIGGGVPVSGPDPGGCEERPGALNYPIKDNTINGNMLISGWTGCWLGVIRNVQHGNLVLIGNYPASVDAMEIVTNTISGNMICLANSPTPQIGDSGGILNSVTGAKVGQCRTL